jgi:hypothetical protein
MDGRPQLAPDEVPLQRACGCCKVSYQPAGC